MLTDSADAKQYIKRMRARDPELNSRWGTICTPVEMLAPDGTTYDTSWGTSRGTSWGTSSTFGKRDKRRCLFVCDIMTAHEIEERAACVVCRISDRETYWHKRINNLANPWIFGKIVVSLQPKGVSREQIGRL